MDVTSHLKTSVGIKPERDFPKKRRASTTWRKLPETKISLPGQDILLVGTATGPGKYGRNHRAHPPLIPEGIFAKTTKTKAQIFKDE